MRIENDFQESGDGSVQAMISGIDAAFRRLPCGGFAKVTLSSPHRHAVCGTGKVD
jgi:hypothetical protein